MSLMCGSLCASVPILLYYSTEKHLTRSSMSIDAIENPNLDEVSLAPRQGELLSLPFDQYGRMRIAENIVRTLYSEIAAQVKERKAVGAHGRAPLHLLDVGGYPGILRHFLTSEVYDISVLDVAPDDGTIPGYRQGSGLDLPYEDDSFDVATGLDTLEHIPNIHRPRFLSEIQRVARHAVVLINPVQSIQADLAEETLNEYIRWVLDAQQEQLAEHRQFGLPDFPATIATFEQAGWKTLSFPTANIHSWLFMMIAKHYLISMRDEQASALERTLDRFYNLAFQESDRAQPAYRGVMVAVRPGLEGALRTIGDMYPPVGASQESSTERLQLAQLLMSMIDLKIANHEDRKLRERLDQANRQILTQQREWEIKYARLEEELNSKNQHILYLEKLLQDIESGRVLRLTRSIARFLGRS